MYDFVGMYCDFGRISFQKCFFGIIAKFTWSHNPFLKRKTKSQAYDK